MGQVNELGHVKILLATPLWGAQYWGRDTNVTVPADLTDVKVGCEAGEAPTILALGECRSTYPSVTWPML